MDKIIRVNLSEGKITTEPVPEKYRALGGRALTGQMLLDEVDPACEPLGLRNKLIFAPGLLGGSFLSSSSRLLFKISANSFTSSSEISLPWTIFCRTGFDF